MNTFTDYLKEKTKKELISLARLHHMTGYSVLHKNELSEKLGDFLLLPEILYSFFVYLGEDELHTFFHYNNSSDPTLLQRLLEGGYCFQQTDGTFVIPEEIKTSSIFTNSFWKDHKKKSFLADCLNAAGYLYGCAPVSILLKLYNDNSVYSLTRERLMKEIYELPDYYNHFIIQNDLIIHKSLYNNNLYQRIQQCQGTLPFYIPTREEILHLSRYGAFPEDTCSRRLSSCLSRLLIIDFSSAQNISRIIQAIYRQGGSIHDAISCLTNEWKLSSQLSGDKQLLSALNELFAHTRLMLNRGNTASEAVHLKKKKTKIYPNSPCPCGSSKKYKNCCGKRKWKPFCYSGS